MRVHVKFTLLIITALAPLFLLGGCSGLPVEKTPLAQSLVPPDDAQPTPISFRKIHFAIPAGTPTIANAPTNLWESIFVCEGTYGLTSQGSLRGRSFPTDSWREIFTSTMESIGYDVAGNPGFLFDESEDLQRANLAVGGRIIDLKINTCEQSGWFGRIPRGDSGEASITIEWTIFDLLHRRNILKTTTKGYGRLHTPNFDGVILLFEQAMAAAIHNLGADEEVHDLVFYGHKPAKTPSTVRDPYEEPIGIFEPNEDLSLETGPLSTLNAVDHMEDIVKSAVLIQSAGHGSGYFVTEQGHIITNAHVVGNAKRIRIVTSGKKEKLIAEVLRVDRLRDVALLKLEKIPEDLKIRTLPIRTEKLKIGEDVYAIGSPSYTQLQDTITKGIVSAHRFNRKKQHWEIQADAYIYGGNSGGPLIDGYGNLVGMSVAGYIRGDENLSGLNLFIPIEDALKKLDIELSTTH